MIKHLVKIIENKPIANQIFSMKLEKPAGIKINPGQFVNIKVDGFSLRRPISICSVENDYFLIIYKTFGDGTLKLSQKKEGEILDILLPLGNYFNIFDHLGEVLLIGGGVGVPPLYELAKVYIRLGKKVTAVFGFKSAADVFLEQEFKELGVMVHIATDDGSYGFKGNALQLAKSENLIGKFVYAVGPKQLLKGVQDTFEKGYISLEERMACGVGMCMGCVCKGKDTSENADKSYRVCKEGPIFKIGKVEL